MIIFTKYRATQKWLVDVLSAEGFGGEDRLMTICGGMDTMADICGRIGSLLEVGNVLSLVNIRFLLQTSGEESARYPARFHHGGKDA